MDIPDAVRNSSLYRQLVADVELLHAVVSLRSVAGALAETITRTVPAFTDHTIRHMDALWSIADCILTQSEIEALSTGEAFLLACSFYLHDIGMAYGATVEGLDLIRSSSAYASIEAEAPPSVRAAPAFAARAVARAIRSLHANAAAELATSLVPGTGIHLFESSSIREAWGETAGRVAASHHWNLDTLDRELGAQGIVPLPGGRKADLGYVASVLRLADYAHINRDRAPKVDRALRPAMEPENLTHWLAQEQVDGPYRDGADLVYRAAAPVRDVDAWWLYYEMLRGLDAEIRAVRRYLDRRAASLGRLSLQGVRGVASPEEAAVFVPTGGFLPIEINLRTGSLEKLVELLAGKSLYGPDNMAAVRELIQNARDAVLLKAATATTDFDRAALSIPIRLALKTRGPAPRLEVIDSGVGMTGKILTDYLISIASDYWTSQFYSDFPNASSKGFQPAGRFGIGFLSVFMLGEEVTVESNRGGGERYRLHLRGVGRRGEIRTVAAPSGSGTAVRVDLHAAAVESLRPLQELVRIYAPMIPHPLEVDVDGEVTAIPAGWLHELGHDEFYKWTLNATVTLARNRGRAARGEEFGARGEEFWWIDGMHYFAYRRNTEPRAKCWIGDWPEYRDKSVRLLASFEGITLLCIRGLAIQPISTPGFVGVIDLESALTDVSRREVVSADVSSILKRATAATVAQIVKNLNALVATGLMIDKVEFLAQCEQLYGRRVILESSVPWVNLLHLPGDVTLVSCAMLRERLTKAGSLFIAYGTGPWTAMRKWVSTEGQPGMEELAVVLGDIPQRSLPYHSGSEEEVGVLSDLWQTCGDAPLFGTILQLAAEAWQGNVGDLITQDGWHHGGSAIWGRIRRP
jgi:hypothetical protein